MRWEDERYVRVYTRDTATWKTLPWQARALLPLLMRKLDRAGLMELGGEGASGIAAVLDLPATVVRPGLAALVKKGVVVMTDTTLVMPNFLEAQEVQKSDALRKREQRERDRLKGMELQKVCPEVSRDVTNSHERSRDVTPVTFGHVLVTPSLAVPCRDVPTRAVPTPTTSPQKAAEPGWQPLVDALFEKFKAHRGVEPTPRGKDWKALQRLRGRIKLDDTEIILRWARGIQSTHKQRVDSFFDLDERWDALSTSGPPRDVRTSPLRAEDMKHSDVTGEIPF